MYSADLYKEVQRADSGSRWYICNLLEFRGLVCIFENTRVLTINSSTSQTGQSCFSVALFRQSKHSVTPFFIETTALTKNYRMSFALAVFSDMDLPVKWITTDCDINLFIVPEYIQSPQFKMFINMTVIILSFTSSELKMLQVLNCILILALKRLRGINRTRWEKQT